MQSTKHPTTGAVDCSTSLHGFRLFKYCRSLFVFILLTSLYQK